MNIIDLLIQLKNASLTHKEMVCLPYNKTLVKVAKILYSEGFIQSFHVTSFKTKIQIYLRYSFNKGLFTDLKILSTPSRPLYLTHLQMLKVSNKTRFLLVETSKGFLNITHCKKQGIGGKLLFSW